MTVHATLIQQLYPQEIICQQYHWRSSKMSSRADWNS